MIEGCRSNLVLCCDALRVAGNLPAAPSLKEGVEWAEDSGA